MVDRLHLTALPTRLPIPPSAEVTRQDILVGTSPDPDLGVPLEPLPIPSETMDGWIRVGFGDDGSVAELTRSPVSVVIVA